MWASCVRQMKSIITSGPGKIHEVGGIAVKKIAKIITAKDGEHFFAETDRPRRPRVLPHCPLIFWIRVGSVTV